MCRFIAANRRQGSSYAGVFLFSSSPLACPPSLFRPALFYRMSLVFSRSRSDHNASLIIFQSQRPLSLAELLSPEAACARRDFVSDGSNAFILLSTAGSQNDNCGRWVQQLKCGTSKAMIDEGASAAEIYYSNKGVADANCVSVTLRSLQSFDVAGFSLT